MIFLRLQFQSFYFLKDSEISYLHVFTYSERPNTEAAVMKSSVSPEIRYKRSKILRTLSIKKRRAFYESQIGNILTVLFESENKKVYRRNNLNITYDEFYKERYSSLWNWSFYFYNFKIIKVFMCSKICFSYMSTTNKTYLKYFIHLRLYTLSLL